MKAYVGNAPSFSSETLPRQTAENIKKENGIINDLSFESVFWVSEEDKCNRQVLIRFPDYRSWPVFIHFMYDELSLENSRIADSIIFCTRSDPFVDSKDILLHLNSRARDRFDYDYWPGLPDDMFQHFPEFLGILEEEFIASKETGAFQDEYRLLTYSELSKAYEEKLKKKELFQDIPLTRFSHRPGFLRLARLSEHWLSASDECKYKARGAK